MSQPPGYPFYLKPLGNKLKVILKRGDIVRVFTDLTDPPKTKRFVVWGIDESSNLLGLSFINTEEFNFKDPILLKSQLFLASSNRPYLDHNSFLDCSWIYEENLNEIIEIIESDPKTILGSLSPDDLADAESFIKFNPMIKIKVKKRYGFIKERDD